MNISIVTVSLHLVSNKRHSLKHFKGKHSSLSTSHKKFYALTTIVNLENIFIVTFSLHLVPNIRLSSKHFKIETL